ncbi:GDP-mannose 4,6-dehydratase [Williamsia phyllosphaerae]|uniref:GDP-mannose 4,6-dehydratase n=1 Tax=Williamsia phyllosphaerae TaxID=885042 RepID=A0ABQ1UWP2_9NOCA|nr:GDP-mannose 4,6-dehydratase [Williamsia phyllosphaerae]GGF28582.1 GDP-mannose 4,6-dehydratase [Williamsia phyllosphaerae]
MTDSRALASPRALISGVTGQDGHYLAARLIEAGITVHGVVGPSRSVESVSAPGFVGHELDLTDAAQVRALVADVAPQHVFHLAGLSSVGRSWTDPVATVDVNAVSVTAVLDACLQFQDETGDPISVVNASSAEVFAGSSESPQDESTAIAPTSPYGVSKALGHMMCQVYRRRGLQATNAILYNHESPRRPATFVTRKITAAAAAIAAGEQDRLTLGNLSLRRDWGWAPDYVDAMYRMALHGKGDDFVVATGESHSVAEFVETAFAAVGITDWRAHVEIDDELNRPADSADMVGDATRARDVLGWQPTKTFEQIVTSMVNADRRQEQNS